MLCLWAVIRWTYLNNKSPKDDGTEDQIIENAFKDISFPVDLPCIDFIKQLHHHKGVEDDGVVLRGGSVKRGITPTVNVKYLLT